MTAEELAEELAVLRTSPTKMLSPELSGWLPARGPLTILVNAAGTDVPDPTADLATPSGDYELAVDLRSTSNICSAKPNSRRQVTKPLLRS